MQEVQRGDREGTGIHKYCIMISLLVVSMQESTGRGQGGYWYTTTVLVVRMQYLKW